MFDAIIVGARCGGSPTAMLLARKGYRVLLVDRATFPSDALSTHFIWQAGTACLHRWGLLDQVRRSGCPSLTKVKLDFGDFVFEGCAPTADPAAPECLCPRRFILDKILVDAARAAGAEVREAFSVREILFDDDRVVGLRGVTSRSTLVEERARIVVGADGMYSLVARAVKAPITIERPIVSCGYYSYWTGFPSGAGQAFFRPERTILAMPTNDGLTCVAVLAPIRVFPEYRARIETTYIAGLALAPPAADSARSGKRVERFAGSADLANFFRKPFGPGWALVGDAGYHKDPYTAQGISDAFRQAEVLARAIDDGFSGRRSLEQALDAYERWRNEAFLAEFHSTCHRAAMDAPKPEAQALLHALQGNQEQIDRFIGTDAGTVAHADFFSPENITSIFAAASRRSAASP